MIYFKDRQCRFIAVSASLVEKHGLGTPDDVIGKSDFDYFATDAAQEMFDREQDLMRTGETMLNNTVREEWADGRITWSLNSKIPLRDDDGRVQGLIGLGRDITATKQMEAALAKAQQDLLEASRLAGMAEIAAGVLHNVGNALNSLNVSLSLIASGVAGLKAESLVRTGQLLSDHAGDLPAFFAADARAKALVPFIVSLGQQMQEARGGLTAETRTAQGSLDHIKAIVAQHEAYARRPPRS